MWHQYILKKPDHKAVIARGEENTQDIEFYAECVPGPTPTVTATNKQTEKDDSTNRQL